jgi:glycogen synthase
MHILMTADTVGGVWTYTRELASGLARRGHRITLISFGKLPSDEQVRWMDGLSTLEFQPTEYHLEWMQNSEQDIRASRSFLEKLIAELKPDLLHFNQYAYGNLRTDVPRIVVAHSDVVSWWVAVHREEPPEDAWIRWYGFTVMEGLKGATAVVAPSRTMLEAIQRHYLQPRLARVIHNGRNPRLFDPSRQKEEVVLSAGRIWDQAKQVSLLLEREQDLPVWIVGSQEHPEGLHSGFVENSNQSTIQFLGAQPEAELIGAYARASLYAATSRYEPFGLAPVEAAFSSCALILNDIDSLRELWGDSGYYFRRNSGLSLAAAIRELGRSQQLRCEYARRAYDHAMTHFQAERMVEEYERLYRSVVAREAAA